MDWLNQNSGATTAIVTLVYTIATIILVFMNYKTIKEMQLTRKQQVLPYVILEVDIIRKGLWCLILKNIGHSIASNVCVKFSFKCEENLGKVDEKNKEIIQRLSSGIIILSPGQSLYYDIGGFRDYDQLSEINIQGQISYTNVFNETVNNAFDIDLHGLEGALMYGNNVDEITTAIKEVSGTLKDLKKEVHNRN